MTPLLRNVIVTFAAVLVIYEGALRLIAPDIEQGQDQFASNTIRLENYVDKPVGGRTVIVGSSLSARLPQSALPSNWANLAVAGGSALTGLEIVASSPGVPRRVLIEINFLDRGFDPEAVNRVVGWPEPMLRQMFWFHRTAYRPMNLFVSLVAGWVKAHRVAPPIERAPSNFERLLALQQKDFAKAPGSGLVSDIADMRRLIIKLQARGTRVSFFEMPTDRRLVNTRRERTLRTEIRNAFAPSSYCWLPLDHGEQWQTGDGLHLLRQDAVLIVERLVSTSCASPKTAKAIGRWPS